MTGERGADIDDDLSLVAPRGTARRSPPTRVPSGDAPLCRPHRRFIKQAGIYASSRTFGAIPPNA
jgi:hypothetical protein